MLIKTLSAGTLAALLAGSMVYFGTPSPRAEGTVAINVQNPQIERDQAELGQVDDIEASEVIVRANRTPDRKLVHNTKSDHETKSSSKGSWLDRLRNSASKSSQKSEHKAEDHAHDEDHHDDDQHGTHHKEDMDSHDVQDMSHDYEGSMSIEAQPVPTFSNPNQVPYEGPRDEYEVESDYELPRRIEIQRSDSDDMPEYKSENGRTQYDRDEYQADDYNGDEGYETVETDEDRLDIEPSEPEVYYKRVGDVLVEVDSLPQSYDYPIADIASSDDRIDVVMKQTAQIRRTEMRDRAYLGIVEYALGVKLYKPAKEAVASIQQAELRDTGRSLIAISYARSGMSDAAFSQIDEVEVEELRDVMRLQVIEALIAPNNLPQPLQ